MLSNHANCHYVVSSVTFYHSALVDISRTRTVHAVEHDPCCPDPTILAADECKAVHYGLCSPLLKLPSFSVPSPVSAPSSPSTLGPGMSPVQQSPTMVTPPGPLLDPVTLLASDLEDQLEALVNTFVAQDKERLAARRKGLVHRLSDESNESPKPLQEGVDQDHPSGDNNPRLLNHPFTLERSTSPSFKSSSILKPSPEYQQTGVKAQISKFASKEKDLQNHPSEKNHKSQPSTFTLDAALQELLLGNEPCHPQTMIFEKPSPPLLSSLSQTHFVPFYDDTLTSSHTYKQSPPYQQDYVQSAVDYAKSRMIQHSQNKINNTPLLQVAKNGVVSDAKHRWDSLDKPDLIAKGVPHPKLTTAQKQHIKERSLSPTHSHIPIRPFLTKGSVAERVLLFECAPDRALERTTFGTKGKLNLISTWRPGTSDVHNKTQPPSAIGSVERERKAGAPIPRFYFPEGRPRPLADIEAHLKRVASVFTGLNDGRAKREEFGIVTKACGLPLYWKIPLFMASREESKSAVACEAFLDFWKKVVTTCNDEATKFIYILSRGKRNYLVSNDFFPMMQDVIDSHPGLTFLKEATEFHSRYIHTVIARIFYCANRSWSGRLTAPELRKSDFLQVLSALEEEEDINQVTDYFSYEHFYVIYCKFWELDKDHDLYIDQNDLKMHCGGALSTRIIQRIFSGAVTRGPKQKEGKMSYTEFVWFLISEEDKRHPRSIEYWFRCMDLDGDGYLSMYELEYFYSEQLQRLEALGIETLPFNDCLCQMLDLLKPREEGKISLSDLKKCHMTPIFFDTFFNLEKYLDHEQRDPFAAQRDGDNSDLSDWDRFAAEEYELLVAEEGANEPQDELIFEDYGEKRPQTEDEDYDYADSDDYHY